MRILYVILEECINKTLRFKLNYGPKLILQLLFIGVTSLLTKQLKSNPLALLITLSLIVIFTILFVKWDSNKEEPLIPLSENGELIIELREGVPMETVLAELEAPASRAFFPADAAATTLDNYLILDAPNTQDGLEKLIDRLESMDEVNYIEYNEVVNLPEETAVLPQKSNKKLGVNDPGIIEQWGLEKLNLEEFHASLKDIKPKKKALIAILDTGVDAKHEDIKGNYKSIKSKHDKDTHRHGTHCAGIAAAVTNNKKGIASLSPNGKFVEVTSVKVLSGFGGGTQSGIICVDIYSTLPNNKYGALSGTSMSTPYVAGLVGIMKSINPKLTTKEVYAILNENSQATQDANKIGRLIQPKKAIESIGK